MSSLREDPRFEATAPCSGLRRDLAEKLRIEGVTTLQAAIALAARVGPGGLTTASSSSSSYAGRGSANQMQMDHDDGAVADLEERVTRAVLNAMHAQGGNSSGLGAKTQTQRGYAQVLERNERSAGGPRGSRNGGAQGRAGQGSAPRLPTIPNVRDPADVVERRKVAGQCFRCGAADHSFRACPNAASPSN